MNETFNEYSQYLDSDATFLIKSKINYELTTYDDLKEIEIFISHNKELFNVEEKINKAKKAMNKAYHLQPLRYSFINDLVLKHHLIVDLANSFSLSSYDLAKNLNTIKLDHGSKSNLVIPPSPSTLPRIASFDLINSQFQSEDQILKAISKFLAKGLSAHPDIRNFVKKLIFKKGLVSTEPSEKGEKELDVFSPFFKVKRLVDKPIAKFKDDSYFLMHYLDKEGLIKIKLDIPKEVIDCEIRDIFLKAYIVNFNKEDGLLNDWNLVRQEVINIMINDILIPEIINEIKEMLLESAEKYVIDECSNKFKELLQKGTYEDIQKWSKNKSNKNTYGYKNNYEEKDIIMSIVYEPTTKYVIIKLNKTNFILILSYKFRHMLHC